MNTYVLEVVAGTFFDVYRVYPDPISVESLRYTFSIRNKTIPDRQRSSQSLCHSHLDATAATLQVQLGEADSKLAAALLAFFSPLFQVAAAPAAAAATCTWCVSECVALGPAPWPVSPGSR